MKYILLFHLYKIEISLLNNSLSIILLIIILRLQLKNMVQGLSLVLD